MPGSTTSPCSALADARRARGLSRQQLANLSGISPKTIARIERREVVPQHATMIVLRAVLGSDLADDPGEAA